MGSPVRRLTRALAALSLWPGFVHSSSPAQADAPARLGCAAPPAAVEVAAGAQRELVVAEGAGPGALLRIDESGHELEYAGIVGAGFQNLGARPPRLGIDFVPVMAGQVLVLRRAAAGEAPAQARVQLLCAPNAEQRALADCASAARAVETVGVPPESSAEAPAVDATCRALLAHAEAAWASRNHRPRAAIAAYERAIAEWAAAGDGAREGAAWLGLAEQWIRLAEPVAARAAAERAEALSAAAGQPYFENRARMERCLALDALGQAPAARACLDGLAARQAALSEWNDAANVRTIEASIALEQGDLLAAERHVAEALRIAPRWLSPLSSGRLRLVEAQVAALRGRLDAALVAIDAGLGAFEAARDRRGLGNARLVAAALLLALDAPADAFAFATAAHREFVAIDAPARIAAARALLARIAQPDADLTAARDHALRAAAIFRGLDMPWRALDATITAAELGAPDAAAAVDAAFAEPATPARLRTRAGLALAARALAGGFPGEAHARLAALGGAVLDPQQAQQRALLAARLALAGGDAAAARAELERAIDRVHATAEVLPGVSLRYALGSQLVALQRVWVDAWAAQPAAQRPDADAVWRVLARSGREVLIAPSAANPPLPVEALARFEAAAAQSLLATDLDRRERDLGPRALLAYEAALERPARTDRDLRPGLEALRARLDADTVLLAVATGEHAALRLLVSREAAVVDELPFDAESRAALARLGELLVQPTSSIASLDAAAQSVSGWLLAGVTGPRPARLLVSGDALRPIGAIGLLSWPGDAAPLIESTATAWLGSARGGLQAADNTLATQVFIASEVEPAAAGAALPALANAAGEADWITASLGAEAMVERAVGPEFTREALARALARPGSTVHIATHGITRRGLLGQSGLLLPRGDDATLQFVSWVGLADQPIGAALLVLNACDLADGPASGLLRQTAFANALAAAGARDTIAALWPISDGAAAIWVPAFYRALARSPQDPGQALRAAQSALRATRMYRHPHYWGALVHLTTIDAAARP